MNQLTSLGIILLMALVAGHGMKWIRVPEVTGYILAGMVIGPSVLRLLTSSTLSALGIFSEVALGLILFSIGSIFEFERFKTIRADVVRIVLFDSVITFTAMFVAMKLAGQTWQVAALFAAVCIETAAASTMMVIKETNAEGPLTDTITGAIAVNNVVCLTVFTLLLGIVEYGMKSGAPTPSGHLLYEFIYRAVWQIAGSVALGYLLGLLVGYWGSRVHEHGELLILLIGSVLLAVGASLLLDLSTLVTSLALGATAANYSEYSRRVFAMQSRTDPPFYAIFFVIAGANLHLSLLRGVGVLGITYFIVRGLAKMLSTFVAARKTSLPRKAKNSIGFVTLAHAGLAIGLVLTLNRRLPTLAPRISTVVLASVLLYELLGPVSAKFGLTRSGEVHPEPLAEGVDEFVPLSM